ncbi:Homocysteine-responsive endoplasmic reticulum-resident ubiquitin domain member 2 protein [Paragonimus kellicotti]|nr:Homocysteine-responsive endoplasmic reticulum-resident ubiquitin domain member 2 protein [Paragonimus kellicotti]
MNNSDIVQTNVNGAHAWPYTNVHFTAPGVHYPQWDQVALANQPHAYWYYSGMAPPPHTQNPPSTFTPPSSQAEAVAAANVAGGNRWFRGARAILAGLGVMNNVEDGVAADANAAPAQQQAMLVGNPMGAGLMGAEDMGEDGGNMDIVDRFYMLFRLCLFIGLCFAYSSLDKAIIVFCVAAYVYFYNIYRRHAAIRQPLVQVPQVRANLVDRPQAASEPSEPSADVNLAETSGHNRPEMDQLLNRRVVQTEQSSPTNEQLPIPAVPEPRISRFTSTLRLVATVSFQFISSLIASLIPEQPPPIRLD